MEDDRTPILQQANYAFSITDEDDPTDVQEQVMSAYKRSQSLVQSKIQAQRKRWKAQVSNKGLVRTLETMNEQQIIHARDHNSTLKQLTRKGIPPEFRGNLWFLISGAHARMRQQEDKKLYYTLLNKYRDHERTEETKQVDADLDRTFPSHPFFARRENQESLRNILYTYSFYNRKIGYCQSMNFLAGVLLLHMPEEHAFWTLDMILSEYLPHDLYDPTMNGLKCELHVLSELTAERLPRVSSYLKSMGIDFLFFSTRWFMCLFVNSVPIETAFRIWDAFFLEGYKILFRISICLLQMMERELLACENMGDAITFLNKYPKEMFDCRNLMKSSFKLRAFSRDVIEKARREYRANNPSP